MAIKMRSCVFCKPKDVLISLLLLSLLLLLMVFILTRYCLRKICKHKYNYSRATNALLMTIRSIIFRESSACSSVYTRTEESVYNDMVLFCFSLIVSLSSLLFFLRLFFYNEPFCIF